VTLRVKNTGENSIELRSVHREYVQPPETNGAKHWWQRPRWAAAEPVEHQLHPEDSKELIAGQSAAVIVTETYEQAPFSWPIADMRWRCAVETAQRRHVGPVHRVRTK